MDTIEFDKPDIEELARNSDEKGLIEALHYGKDWEVRWTAAMTLGEMRDLGAVDALIQGLGDEHGWVRWGAAWALGEIGDSKAIKPLRKVLKDNNPGVKEEARRSINKLATDETA